MLMDEVLSLIYQDPGSTASRSLATGLGVTRNHYALYEMRLLPLMFARTVPNTPSDHGLARLHRLQEAAGVITRELELELRWFMRTCRSLELPIVPIKGCDQLLWGLGRRGELHTRDIDVLIDASDYAQVCMILRARGYQQLGRISRTTGECEKATCDQLSSAETDQYYGYFPWSRLVRTPELDWLSEFVEAQVALNHISYPLLMVKGAAYIVMDFDLHHSLWPGTPFKRLELEVATFDGNALHRLALRDRLVFHGCHMGSRLMGSSFRRAWGAFAQLVHTMQTETPASYDQCEERAREVGLLNQWRSVAALVVALARRCGADPKPFPPSDDFIIRQAEADYDRRWAGALDA